MKSKRSKNRSCASQMFPEKHDSLHWNWTYDITVQPTANRSALCITDTVTGCGRYHQGARTLHDCSALWKYTFKMHPSIYCVWTEGTHLSRHPHIGRGMYSSAPHDWHTTHLQHATRKYMFMMQNRGENFWEIRGLFNFMAHMWKPFVQRESNLEALIRSNLWIQLSSPSPASTYCKRC